MRQSGQLRGDQMRPMKVGVVIGSTRPSRFGDKPAAWICDLAARRSDMAPELLDLRDFPLPFFEGDRSPIYGPSSHPAIQAWAARLAPMDGFIMVTPEYNRGPPAVLKNALDVVYPEFARKPVGFVGYGGVGGARAIEQLRLVCVELQMAPIRFGVHIGGSDFLRALKEGIALSEFEHLNASAAAMLDDFAWWLSALSAARKIAPATPSVASR